MKNLPSFPQLPTDLPTKELRQEIRRRLEETDKMGLIKRPKNAVRR
jgi:hypothetical protein